MEARDRALRTYYGQEQRFDEGNGPWLHPSRAAADRSKDWPAGWWIVPSVLFGALIWGLSLFGVIGLFAG
jgi:hypothetical protein